MSNTPNISDSKNVDTLRPLECNFESTSDTSGHTEYVIRFALPHFPSVCWSVIKRYSEFTTLHDAISIYGLGAELPPKKAFGNKERDFIAERQRGLEAYLKLVLENLFLISSKDVKLFLHPGSKLSETANSAVQLMAMVFRTDHKYELTGHFPNIGWRSIKEFAGVKSIAEPKQKLMGCWTFYGPDRAASPAEIGSFLQSLSQTNHPLFYPLLFADARDTGCVSVRSENPQGSLLDVIKGAKSKQHFLHKYAKSKRGKGLSLDEVQRYGRQILEALKFFHDNSIPYGNLTSRNVIIDSGRARISEIENGLCGLRSFYWPYILNFRKINTFEAIDVYCFGQVLYEMVFGQSLESPACDTIHPACPPLVRAVLESILTPEACKVGMPSVSQLLTQPLFHNITLNYDPATMKISKSLKGVLANAKQSMEALIAQEQKAYHHHIRELKVHSIQSSEDERKKRRLMALKSQVSTDMPGLDDALSNGRSPTPTSRNADTAGTSTSSAR